MEKNLFYVVMDHLPKIPQELVDIALDRVKSKELPATASTHQKDQNPIYERNFTRNGVTKLSRSNPRWGLEDVFSDWINKNITTEWKQLGVSTSIVLKGSPHFVSEELSVDQVPHTDLTRHYTLMYLLAKGNEDQYTSWYQEPGYPLQRKRDVIMWESDHLKKLGSVIFPTHTWVMFNTNILHNAENVKNERIAIHVGLEVDPFGVFMRTEPYADTLVL
jgi:hypothetical protein